MSPKNPTEEIRALRRELNERSGGDLDRIVDELRALQSASGRVFLNLPDEMASSDSVPPRSDLGSASPIASDRLRTATAG